MICVFEMKNVSETCSRWISVCEVCVKAVKFTEVLGRAPIW